jgi:hypothetical protein
MEFTPAYICLSYIQSLFLLEKPMISILGATAAKAKLKVQN